MIAAWARSFNFVPLKPLVLIGLRAGLFLEITGAHTGDDDEVPMSLKFEQYFLKLVEVVVYCKVIAGAAPAGGGGWCGTSTRTTHDDDDDSFCG